MAFFQSATSRYRVLPLLLILGSQSLAANESRFVEQVRDHYVRYFPEIREFYCHYRLYEGTEDAKPVVEVIDAYRDKNVYEETYHFSDDPLMGTTNGRDNDPIRNTIVKRDGVMLQYYREPQLLYVNASQSAEERVLKLHGYFGSIGLPPPEQQPFLWEKIAQKTAAKEDSTLIAPADFFLPTTFNDLSWQKVGSEVIEGVPCVVIERSLNSQLSDRMWIDPALSFAVRKREIDSPSGTFLHIANSNFTRLSEGLAFPKRSRVNRPGATLTYEVSDIRLSASPKLFELRITSGTFVRNRITETHFILPGGVAVLDTFVARAKKLLVTEEFDNESPAISRFRGALTPYLPAAAIVVVALFWNRERDRKDGLRSNRRRFSLPINKGTHDEPQR